MIHADLHIHSCLSPCASLDMSPSKIVDAAKQEKLKMIALTDHNSALNCELTAKLCQKAGIHFIPGMEVCTREEVHVLCLFDQVSSVLKLNDLIYAKLPDILKPPEKFGDQVYVNEKEEIIGTVDKYLNSAADISLEELKELVFQMDGLFIPAHVDRQHFGLIAQLGFLPQDNYSAIELSPYFKAGSHDLLDYPVLTNSDAHELKNIGKRFNKLTLPHKFQLKDLPSYVAPWKNI